MVSGFWVNQDGLPLQFGQLKAQPELGGDYLVYGETREMEQIIALVPYQLGTGGVTVPAVPTAFSGTSTPIAAGIQSMTNMFPLQVTAPVTTLTGGVLQLTAPQLFIEEVTVETLVGAAGGTSIAVGLATTTSGPSAGFVQVTPNAGAQILTGFLTASMATPGQVVKFYAGAESFPATTAGAGAWIGNVPLVTNAITPLPTQAFLSTIATGTFTNGLIKLRIRYTIYGNINY